MSYKKSLNKSRNLNSILSNSFTYKDYLCKLYKRTTDSDLNIRHKKELLNFLKSYLFLYEIRSKKLGIISDTHIGNTNENWEYIKRAYECFYQNGINSVLHLGDLLDGYCGTYDVKKSSLHEMYENQIEELKLHYPQGFETYVVLGNHDENFLINKVNLIDIISNIRPDILFTGLGVGYIKWNEKEIKMKHKLSKTKMPFSLHDCHYCLKGHSHLFQYEKPNNTIRIPTCSDNHPYFNNLVNEQAGFLILEKTKKDIMLERYIFEENNPVLILKQKI